MGNNKFITLMKNLVYMQMQIDDLLLNDLKKNGKQTYYRIMADVKYDLATNFFMFDFIEELKKHADGVKSLSYIIKVYRKVELHYIENYNANFDRHVLTFDEVVEVINTLISQKFMEIV